MLHKRLFSFTIVFILFFAAIGSCAASGQMVPETDPDEAVFWMDAYVLILKTTKSCQEAVNVATKAGKALNLEFDNESKECSDAKGVYYSEDIDDEMYRGGYAPRRYEGEYISLENSDGYKDFSPGKIIVVSGIYKDGKNARKALKAVRKFYPDAYAKKTTLWMGCIH